jgi:hypothetical protein
MVYANFVGPRTSSKLAMLSSLLITRDIRPEERFKTGTLAQQPLLGLELHEVLNLTNDMTLQHLRRYPYLPPQA